MEEETKPQTTEVQGKNKGYNNILPYMWKKGQSGNPAGRPKGKTMKEYARELLACQTEEERQEFLHGLPKEIIWKMAEGNPQEKIDHTTKGEKIEFGADIEALLDRAEEGLIKKMTNGEDNSTTDNIQENNVLPGLPPSEERAGVSIGVQR